MQTQKVVSPSSQKRKERLSPGQLTMAFHPEKLLLPLCYLMMMIAISHFLILPCASQKSFNYPDFSQTNNEAIIRLKGSVKISGSVIQLTPKAADNWGRVMYTEPMHLWEKSTGKVANFTTNFSFIISSEGNDNYSDGLTFFLAGPYFPLPDPVDGSGTGLLSREQMSDSSFLDANKFVAMEFDTYRNEEWDDPPEEHVGININNMTSRITTKWHSLIKEKRTYSCSISYDPNAQNLSVSFTGFNSTESNDTIPIEQQLSFIVDLTDYLPERVHLGFSSSTGLIYELHILSSWSLQWTAPLFIHNSPQPQKESKAGLVVGLSVGACVLIVGGLGLVWLINRKKKLGIGGGDEDLDFDLSMDDEFERGTGPKRFSYNELVRVTNNFVGENKLGEGGFGGVYKGFLREMNSYIAVKRVSKGSKQGIKECASEVKSISRLRHRSLVQLIGWCHEHKDLLLVYEFMPNGSLDSHIFKGKSLLTWAMGYNIAQGLASVLLYLHEEWEQCVLHRDIKSNNIMLDSSFNAKLGDFGLARMVEHAEKLCEGIFKVDKLQIH